MSDEKTRILEALDKVLPAGDAYDMIFRNFAIELFKMKFDENRVEVFKVKNMKVTK